MITRLASDPRTQAYMERRVKDGRSKSEAIRMLKRYVAREVYRHLPRAEIPGPWTWLSKRLSSIGLTSSRFAGSWSGLTDSRRRVT